MGTRKHQTAAPPKLPVSPRMDCRPHQGRGLLGSLQAEQWLGMRGCGFGRPCVLKDVPPPPTLPPAVQGVHPTRAGNALPPYPPFSRFSQAGSGWCPCLVPKTLVSLCPESTLPLAGWSVSHLVKSVFMDPARQVCGSGPSLRAVHFLSGRVRVLSDLPGVRDECPAVQPADLTR